MSYKKKAKDLQLGDYIFTYNNSVIEARKVVSLALKDTNSGQQLRVNDRSSFMIDHSACVDLLYFTSFDEAKETQINRLTSLLIKVGSQTDPTPKS